MGVGRKENCNEGKEVKKRKRRKEKKKCPPRGSTEFSLRKWHVRQ